MAIGFAFPTDPLNPSKIDPVFDEQAAELRLAGFAVLRYSPDRPNYLKSSMQAGDYIIYRGWMMDVEEYTRFVEAVGKAVSSRGSAPSPLHALDQYLLTHHIPRWHELLADLTIETVFLPADADLPAELAKLDWPGYFLKDHVKSLKTSLGSTFTRPEDAVAVAEEMKKYRGAIEGGFSVRKYTQLDTATETRYFVLDKQPYAANQQDKIPDIVYEAAKRLVGSRFFSVDVAKDKNGRELIVEVGDGQVSDLVGAWTPRRFAEMWSGRNR